MKYIVALNYQYFCRYVEQELGLSKHNKDVFFVSTSYRGTNLRGRRIRDTDEVIKVDGYAEGRYLAEVLGDLEICKL